MIAPQNSPRSCRFFQVPAAKSPSHPARPGLGAREPLMLAAISRLLPHAAKFTRQIVPPVVATLIAAGLISAYNRAFSGHLQQPRMAALHHETEAAIEPVTRP